MLDSVPSDIDILFQFRVVQFREKGQGFISFSYMVSIPCGTIQRVFGGFKEANKVLLNTYGIINVDISGNTFRNNPVKLVALLWGAKNNSHSDNTISNSGKIQVEENLKLNLLY
ncbi:MAG: hypothetical protein ACJA01_002798 [Saprospiraceae bacterium]|jgi:hypothetical protein